METNFAPLYLFLLAHLTSITHVDRTMSARPGLRIDFTGSAPESMETPPGVRLLERGSDGWELTSSLFVNEPDFTDLRTEAEEASAAIYLALWDRWWSMHAG